MAKGTIRRLLVHRGVGFIRSEDGRDVFFHRSEVLHVPFGALWEGQAVEFMVVETPQGPKAHGVRVTLESTPLPLQASQ